MKDQENADSTIGASQSGAQTGGAQAGAGQATQGAAASTGASQAGAGAQGNLAQTETVSDVGQGEASILQMQMLVADQLSLRAQLNQIIVTQAQRLAAAAADFDAQLRAIAIGQLQNAALLNNRTNNNSADLDLRAKSDGLSSDSRRQDNAETHDKQMDAISVSERERTVRGGDAGDVIRWAGLSENPVFQDAISAAVASGFEKATTKIVNK